MKPRGPYGDSPYRGPSRLPREPAAGATGERPRRDEAPRERRAERPAVERPAVERRAFEKPAVERPGYAAARPPRDGAPPRRDAAQNEGAPSSPPRPRAKDEARLFGLNACLAAFARRPQDLRKLWLAESRVAALRPLLAWCVTHRLGYRVVGEDDLAKLAGSQHHEGVCMDLLRRPFLALSDLLAQVPPAPRASLLLVLDGVGNPHNVGAVLRSAANFGVDGLILPPQAPPTLSGAACRVAEGGAEAVSLAQAQPGEDLLGALRAAGYRIAATSPHQGQGLYEAALPPRLALIFGAEGEGMSEALLRAADLRITIPGTGKVESLNISASAAVLLGEWFRTARA